MLVIILTIVFIIIAILYIQNYYTNTEHYQPNTYKYIPNEDISRMYDYSSNYKSNTTDFPIYYYYPYSNIHYYPQN